jgi:hypothetical protein
MPKTIMLTIGPGKCYRPLERRYGVSVAEVGLFLLWRNRLPERDASRLLDDERTWCEAASAKAAGLLPSLNLDKRAMFLRTRILIGAWNVAIFPVLLLLRGGSRLYRKVRPRRER